MNNIQTINPEEFLEQSKANHFMIMLSSPLGTMFCLPGGATQNTAVNGFMDSPAVERKNLVDAYHEASRNVKSNPLYPEARLDIVEIPSWD